MGPPSVPMAGQMDHDSSGTIKMEARGVQNGSPGCQNESQELQDEAPERQDGHSECASGCPDGSWRFHLRLKVVPKANWSAPGSVRDRFWTSWDFCLGRSSINFEQAIPFRSIPCVPGSVAAGRRVEG